MTRSCATSSPTGWRPRATACARRPTARAACTALERAPGAGRERHVDAGTVRRRGHPLAEARSIPAMRSSPCPAISAPARAAARRTRSAPARRARSPSRSSAPSSCGAVAELDWLPRSRARQAGSRIPLGARADRARHACWSRINVALGDLGRAQGPRAHRAARAARLLQPDAACSPSRPRPRWRRSTSSCATRARNGSAAEVVAGLPQLRDELAHMPQVAALAGARRRRPACSRAPARRRRFDPASLERPASPRTATAAPTGCYLSEPYRAAPSGQLALRACRGASSGADGAFGGVMAAAIELESFDRLYRAIDLGDGGFITLLSHGRHVITRVPDPANARGRSFPEPEHRPSGARAMAASTAGRTSPILNERVLLAASAVRGFPLLVPSGADRARGVRAVARRGLAASFDAHAAHLGGDARPDRARRLGPRAARARARSAAGSATRR